LAATGVNIHWVLTGKGGRYVSDPPADMVRDGDQAGAGYDTAGALYAEVVECIVQRDSGDLRARPPVMAFRRQWLTQQFGVEEQGLFLLRVIDDSMNPTLRSGDMVLIDGRQLPACSGDGLYLLRLGQALMIRRLQTLPGGRCRAVSANPEYAAFIIRLDDDAEIRVLGRVVWAGQQV
ncbi:MAG TPA: LexA family transcriptional regulator, partial [Chromatiales bacterium]|nr:LexA family transcriptional regulator [Chromatiales bacterium]